MSEGTEAPATFGQRLKGWREAAGLSQAALDEAIGKTRGFTAQLETDRLKPPPQDVCERYDSALGRAPGETWQDAAAERLRAFDPDLYAWHREQLGAASSLPPEILGLLDALRLVASEYRDRLQMTRPHDDGGARAARQLDALLRAAMAAGPDVLGTLDRVLGQVRALHVDGTSEQSRQWVANIVTGAWMAALASMHSTRIVGVGARIADPTGGAA